MFAASRRVLKTYDALPGTYAIIPTARDAGVSGSWHLRIFTAGVQASSLREVPLEETKMPWQSDIIGWLHVTIKRAWGLPAGIFNDFTVYADVTVLNSYKGSTPYIAASEAPAFDSSFVFPVRRPR